MASKTLDGKSSFVEDKHAHEHSPTDVETNELDLKTTNTVVEGTTKLYVNGKLRCVPMPTGDPKDPMNLPPWRKFMAILSLCFFGSMALSAQQILGSLLPVFVFVYAGLDPNIITNGSGGPPPSTSTTVDPNPLASLAGIPNAPPLSKINLLSSLPILVVGLSNYFLVPLSIIFGRRPVIICCGLLAWVCCIWAGKSTSLNEHIAARCFQAVGGGAVESLIPYIVQDMSFIHQRNRAIGVIWASQGIATLALGIGSNYIVARMGWRWLYFILGILCAVSWLMVIAFVPETRWKRSPQELRGESDECPPGEVRPPLDYERYGPRTLSSNLGVFRGGVQWRDGAIAMKEIVISLFFPNVFLIILLNAAFIGTSLASSQTLTPVLLAPPYSWAFSSLGYSVVAIVIASIFVYVIGSEGSDRMSNWLTKRRGGEREPEVHLFNFIFPLSTGILGCILFGIGGSYSTKVHWITILMGLGMLNFSFLTINIIGSVYCIECFPTWAGPVLVNAASFRNILGFAISYGVTDWVTARGYIGCYGIFAGVIGVLSLGIPVLFIFGKRMRKRVGKVVKKTAHSD